MSQGMKRNVTIIGGGILLGLLVLAASGIFDLDKDQMWNLYFGAAMFIFGGSIAYNMFHQLRFMSRVRKTLAILQEEKDLDGFLKATEELKETVASKPRKALLNLNLSYGYSKKENFQRAKEILEEIDVALLGGINKAIYYSNMVSYCFALGQDKEGLELLDRHDEFLQKHEKTPEVYLGMQVNRLYALLAKGEPKEAKEWALKLQPYCQNEDQLEELGKVKQKIAETLNDYKWLEGEEDDTDCEQYEEITHGTDESNDLVIQVKRSALRTVQRHERSLQ